jgi:hypothetical protein
MDHVTILNMAARHSSAGAGKQLARTATAVLAVSGMAGLIVSLACSCDLGQRAQAVPGNARVVPTNSQTLDATADSVTEFCSVNFSDSYAGLELRHDTGQVIIYGKPSPALDRSVQQRYPSLHLIFRDARFSNVETRRLAAQVAADIPYWRSQGIDVQVVKPLNDGRGVEIDVRQGAAASRPLQARYGSDRITVRQAAVDLSGG